MVPLTLSSSWVLNFQLCDGLSGKAGLLQTKGNPVRLAKRC